MMYVGTASGSNSAQSKMRRPGKSCAATSHAVPVPITAVRMPTPVNRISVSRIAAGRMLPVKCAQRPSDPADAVTTSATIGAATASATAPETISQGFQRGRCDAAGVSLLIESDLIDEPACGTALLRDVCKRRRIHFEITERRNDRIDGGAL